jgi:ferric-dicitrate binding protein FerR (iron transport regulator)
MNPNTRRRLTVSAGDLTIIDTATIFAVRMTDTGEPGVVVQEGQVRVSGPHLSPTVVSQNEIISLKPDDPRPVLRAEAVTPREISVIDWHGVTGS